MNYYELTEESFIGGSLKPAGMIVAYADERGPNDPKPNMLNMRPSTREAYEAQPQLHLTGTFSPPEPPAGPKPFDPSRPVAPLVSNV